MKRKGYTLIEIMIVMAIFGLLFAAIFEILTMNRTTWDIGLTQQTAENQARIGLENMARELYNSTANRVTILPAVPPTLGNTITFQIPIGYEAGGTGNLLWGAEAGGTPNFSIRYSINGNNQLVRDILDAGNNPTGNNRILANNAQNVQFALANNLLAITLTIQKNAANNRQTTQTFTSSVTFRN